ncbi:hypothetical protein [Rhodocista pekingensis]|uniref:Uncharacterized protein n=1 Tax=Rhodocista pekingensis TaxID=201185 RepID=A0ABW2KXZ2_9PROT
MLSKVCCALSLALGVAALGHGAVTLAAPAVARTAPAYAPVSDFLAGRRVGPDLQTRLDASMARLEALSVELRAAVGDATAYARLRAKHDLEVKTHKALTGEANRASLPMGTAS